jgi:hypothetical protein
VARGSHKKVETLFKKTSQKKSKNTFSRQKKKKDQKFAHLDFCIADEKFSQKKFHFFWSLAHFFTGKKGKKQKK